MLGFKVDEVKIITDIDDIIHKNVIVCIHNQKLSRNHNYSGLIGLDILEGSEENEYFTNIKV